jgi:hypothetical protein
VRKLISILVALGLLVSFSAMATPVAAVEEGSLDVCVGNPIAGQNSTYCITFHNIGTLKSEDDDYIDIMFPTGTDTSGATVIRLQKSPKPPPPPDPWCAPCDCDTDTAFVAPPAENLAMDVQYMDDTIRIVLDGTDEYIEKCDFVLIVVDNVTNPTSCSHHLEVGTSTHTPVDSNDYTIYCTKIELNGGKNPNTGLDVMNLISIPCYPIDTSIEVVLEKLFTMADVTASSAKPFTFSVWYYDSAAKKWLKYVSDSSFTDLKTIEAGKSYWIKPSQGITFFVHGTPYVPGQGPPVKWCYPRCWNMVGFASLVEMDPCDYLDYAILLPSGDSAVMAIWWFDNTPDVQRYMDTGWRSDTGCPSAIRLKPGVGYWMAFFEEACIIPPI